MSDMKPISCDEALRLLADYLDQELHFAEQEGMVRHLETCRSCFSRAEFERRLKEEISRLGHEPTTPAFEQRIKRLLGSFITSSAAEPTDSGQA